MPKIILSQLNTPAHKTQEDLSPTNCSLREFQYQEKMTAESYLALTELH